MPRCEATVTTPERANTGGQCRRNAVKGTVHCERHGGVPEALAGGLTVTARADRAKQVCTAQKRDGTPCSKYAIRGAFVCRSHGGALPNVQRAARKRMLDMVPLALRELQEILERPSTADADKLRAITLLLDRSGLGPQAELSLEVKPWEGIFSRIARELPLERLSAADPAGPADPTAAGEPEDSEVVEAEVIDEPTPTRTARPASAARLRPPLALSAMPVSAEPPAHLRGEARRGPRRRP